MQDAAHRKAVIDNNAMFFYNINMSGRNKRNISAGLIVWAAAAFGLVLVFIIKYKDISNNLKETAFFDRIRGKTPVSTKNSESGAEIELNVLSNSETVLSPVSDVSATPNEASDKKELIKHNEESEAISDTNVEGGSVSDTTPQQDNRKDTIAIQNAPQTQVKLYFVSINSDGTVSRWEVERSLPRTGVPLTDAVNAVLEGPSDSEKSKGLLSFVPVNTKLLGAAVKNKIAMLNFNEAFEYNNYGVEGYLAQLTQIVYTATSFPTVDSVQFLIEGQKKEYLGGEGVWIGSPLSRSSFK